jgi:type II secretory pathway pseudopilin PulG
MLVLLPALQASVRIEIERSMEPVRQLAVVAATLPSLLAALQQQQQQQAQMMQVQQQLVLQQSSMQQQQQAQPQQPQQELMQQQVPEDLQQMQPQMEAGYAAAPAPGYGPAAPGAEMLAAPPPPTSTEPPSGLVAPGLSQELVEQLRGMVRTEVEGAVNLILENQVKLWPVCEGHIVYRSGLHMQP